MGRQAEILKVPIFFLNLGPISEQQCSSENWDRFAHRD